jgi:hypothetical protein
VLYGPCDELRTVVRADEGRLSSVPEQTGKGGYYILGGDGALYFEVQALTGVLIYDWHHL